jgi:hypothetical protein
MPDATRAEIARLTGMSQGRVSVIAIERGQRRYAERANIRTDIRPDGPLLTPDTPPNPRGTAAPREPVMGDVPLALIPSSTSLAPTSTGGT